MRRVKVATVGGGLSQDVLVDVRGDRTAAARLGSGHEGQGAYATHRIEDHVPRRHVRQLQHQIRCR